MSAEHAGDFGAANAQGKYATSRQSPSPLVHHALHPLCRRSVGVLIVLWESVAAVAAAARAASPERLWACVPSLVHAATELDRSTYGLGGITRRLGVARLLCSSMKDLLVRKQKAYFSSPSAGSDSCCSVTALRSRRICGAHCVAAVQGVWRSGCRTSAALFESGAALCGVAQAGADADPRGAAFPVVAEVLVLLVLRGCPGWSRWAWQRGSPGRRGPGG